MSRRFVTLSVLVALAALPAAGPASADWVEIAPQSGTVATPTVAPGGTANVPVPQFREERVCFLNGPVVLCVDLVFLDGVQWTSVPFVTVGSEDREVTWYFVNVWSPATASFSCGPTSTSGNGRYATVATATDMTGSHQYTPFRSHTVYLNQNFIVTHYFDSACRRVDGTAVDPQLLP